MSSDVNNDINDLLTHAFEAHRAGSLTEAENRYQAVLKVDPEHPQALQLLGVIAAQLGNYPLAIERVNASLAVDPNQPGALNNLGNMLYDEGRYDEAIDAYEHSLHLDDSNSQTYAHLGHVFSYVDRYLDAINAYTKVTEIDPENVSGWCNLGDSLERLGRLDDAVDAFQTALKVEADYLPALSGLGKALRLSGRFQEARDVYRNWLELDPDNPGAKHFLFVCDPSEQTPDRASSEFVVSTFDQFAEKFDTVLTKLNYRVPELIAQCVKQLYPGQRTNGLQVVDLGCGTGLCAGTLKTVASRLVGVDLSPKMLEKAKERELYDELIEDDLTQFLTAYQDAFDLIVSADTLLYIGDLHETFRATANALSDGGNFVFTVEKLDDADERAEDPGFALGQSGRYMHSEGMIRHWAQDVGLEVNDVQQVTLREERGKLVAGLLVTMRKETVGG